MPCFRGIDVSIVVQPGAQKIREFPHPDASSVRLLPPCAASSSPQNSASSSPGKDSLRIQKTKPTVSVYIPSVPATKFWIDYVVNPLPDPPKYLFFKVFMNGRNIANWGIDPDTQASGAVNRALYDPCDRWHYKQEGVVLKRDGIESRSFYFTAGPNASVAADDGGLIEVQVFRAQSRRRKAPVLGEYRSQDRYGIVSPSEGLLDCPEDATYYDWILTDPTDSPYASFRFHYRAWDYLLQLNLVSDDVFADQRSNQLLHRGSSLSSSSKRPESRKANSEIDYRASCSSQDIPLNSIYDDAVFPSDSDSNLTQRDSKAAFANDFAFFSQQNASQIDTTFMPRRSSLSSYAPSIAPSLLPYVEEESTVAEEVEFGMATKIPIGGDPFDDATGRRPLPPLPKRTSSCYDKNSPPSSLSSGSMELRRSWTCAPETAPKAEKSASGD